MASREGAKKIEGAKTIAGASNRSRVVTDAVGDYFMHLWRPLGVARVPSRLAATRGASPSSQVPEHEHPAARPEPSHEVAKSAGETKFWESRTCYLVGRDPDALRSL